MENEDKRNNENKFAEKCRDTSCCNGLGMFEAMAGCCKGMSGSGDSRSMMAGYMKMCRWFPLVPVIFGIALFVLGYYLDASIIRVLWMLFAGFMAVLGIFGLILMGTMKKMCC
jgi:hypothetical protein